MPSRRSAAVYLVLLVGLIVAALVLQGPPSPVPASAPTSEFSAERAMRHVNAIAQRPHPTGSADHDRVRDYIIGEAGRLGLDVQRQTATAVRAERAVLAGSVENLLVRIPGTATSGALLLAAHYDAGPVSLGAADDGAGVAALLETLRALRAGPPLRNDLLVLFTDAEENGLLGAAAFVDEHPRANDVKLVVNVEARGMSGPSLMFETTPGNGRLISELATAVPSPNASSLSYEIYKRLPNDTDLTVFKTHGVAGLNFAFIGQVTAYHTPLDRPGGLDQGSLQHQGGSTLGLARRFGNLDLGALRDADAVFFSLPFGLLVHYPESWALWLAVIAVVLFVWAVVRARRRKTASLGGIVVAILIMAVLLALSIYGGWRLEGGLSWLHTRVLPAGPTAWNAGYAIGLVGLVVTAWLAVYALLRRRFAACSLALAGAFFWTALAGAAAYLVPGASYAGLWPLAGGLAAIVLVSTRGADGHPGLLTRAALCLLALPALGILPPLVQMVFTSMGLQPTGAAGVAGLAALTVAILLPQIEVVTDGRRFWPAGVALVAAVASAGFGAAVSTYGPGNPKPSVISYTLDADSGRAHWVSRTGDRPDPWQVQYLTETPARGPVEDIAPVMKGVVFLEHAAPAVALAPPEATLVASEPSGGGRIVTVRVTSPRHAPAMSVFVLDADVKAAWVNGRAVPEAPGGRQRSAGMWRLEYTNVPPQGIDVKLALGSAGPVKMVIADRSEGLPAIPGRTFSPRPDWLMAVYEGDVTLVRRSCTF